MRDATLNLIQTRIDPLSHPYRIISLDPLCAGLVMASPSSASASTAPAVASLHNSAIVNDNDDVSFWTNPPPRTTTHRRLSSTPHHTANGEPNWNPYSWRPIPSFLHPSHMVSSSTPPADIRWFTVSYLSSSPIFQCFRDRLCKASILIPSFHPILTQLEDTSYSSTPSSKLTSSIDGDTNTSSFIHISLIKSVSPVPTIEDLRSELRAA